jgi:hypothetical protein
MKCNVIQCQGEPKDNLPPCRYNSPTTEHSQKNKLTDLVDVASADHGDRALRPGPKQNLEKKAKPNFQGTFPGRSSAR